MSRCDSGILWGSYCYDAEVGSMQKGCLYVCMYSMILRWGMYFMMNLLIVKGRGYYEWGYGFFIKFGGFRLRDRGCFDGFFMLGYGVGSHSWWKCMDV